jgi:dihydroflavonol-4-reductase
MRALVTGATGFIGRRLVDRLLAGGNEVVALVRDRGPGGRGGLPPGVRVHPGDLTRPETLGDAGRGCARLYHLAGLVTFDPRAHERLHRVNGRGTADLLSAAAGWGVARTVVVSSACTVGLADSARRLLDEDAAPTRAVVAANPYLASKLEAERVAVEAARTQHVVVVNPSTVYGPGDHSLNSGTLIRQVARAPAVPVPPGGSNVVDVDDVVTGILLAAERGHPGRRYLLGGHNLSFREIIETIVEVTGRRPWLLPVPRIARGLCAAAAWGVGRLAGARLLTPQIVDDLFAFKFYSSRRAREELGWAARASFEQSVRGAWAYYRERGLL